MLGLLSPMAQVKVEVTILRSTSEFWFGHGIPARTWFNGFTLQDDFTQVARQGAAVLVVGPLAAAFAQQYLGCRGGPNRLIGAAVEKLHGRWSRRRVRTDGGRACGGRGV